MIPVALTARTDAAGKPRASGDDPLTLTILSVTER